MHVCFSRQWPKQEAVKQHHHSHHGNRTATWDVSSIRFTYSELFHYPSSLFIDSAFKFIAQASAACSTCLFCVFRGHVCNTGLCLHAQVKISVHFAAPTSNDALHWNQPNRSFFFYSQKKEKDSELIPITWIWVQTELLSKTISGKSDSVDRTMLFTVHCGSVIKHSSLSRESKTFSLCMYSDLSASYF